MSEPIIKFNTRWGKIERVEVERESENCVWVNKRRRAKRSGYDNYFDSFSDAKAFLVMRAQAETDRCKANLQKARSALGNALSLKETP